MTDSTSNSSSAISLDDLVALNDEIGALVRAGVPLDVGLQGFALQAPRHLADLSGRLANSMSEGMSLADALESKGVGFSKVYRYVIEAGLRAGRLPQAMEALSAYARNLISVRRRIALSIIYPCIILVVAYYLFWLIVGGLTTAMIEITTLPGRPPSFWLEFVQSAHKTVAFLGHVPPIVLGLLWLTWEVSSRMMSRSGGVAGIGLRWIPGLGGTIRYFQLANFAELAAVLVDRDVPVQEAFQLAAEATGDRRIVDDAERISTVVGRGEPLANAIQLATSLPPFMRWMIQNGARQDALATSLQQVSDVYRRRAVARSERFAIWFPVLVTIIVGGGAVLVYVLMLFAPLLEMLKSLGTEGVL